MWIIICRKSLILIDNKSVEVYSININKRKDMKRLEVRPGGPVQGLPSCRRVLIPELLKPFFGLTKSLAFANLSVASMRRSHDRCSL